MKNKTVIKTLLAVSVVSILVSAVSYAEEITIQADKQTYDGKTTTFEGNVDVDYIDINVKSPRVVIKSNSEGQTETATFLDGAKAVKERDEKRNEVKANIINLSLLNNRIKAQGDSESDLFEGKNHIVNIKADMQEFDIENNIIVATKDVLIKYGEIDTVSDKARITIDEDGELEKVELLGKATVNQKKSIINADDIVYNPVTSEMVAMGNVFSKTFLEDGTPVDIYSDFQQYDEKTQTLITSGNVKIDYKEYIASGPKATFIPDETANTGKPNKIVFLGRSVINEGDRHIEADRIEITIEPQNFIAVGNVKTKFTQVKSYKGSKKESKKNKDSADNEDRI